MRADVPNATDERMPAPFSPRFFPAASVNNMNTAALGGSSSAINIGPIVTEGTNGN